MRRKRVDSETFCSAERVRLYNQHAPYSRYQVMEIGLCSKQEKVSYAPVSSPVVTWKVDCSMRKGPRIPLKIEMEITLTW